MYRKALIGTAAFGLLAVLTVSVVAASPGDGDSQAFGFLVSALTDAQDKGLLTDAMSDSLSGWFVENVIAPHTGETPGQVRDRLSFHGKTSFEKLILALTDAHEKGLLSDSTSDLISEWVIENVIAPGTGETPEDVRNRLSASPTPSPTPTATPTPAPTIPFSDLDRAADLEDEKPDDAKRIKALPWVADGVDESEREAAEALIWAAIRRPDTFDALLLLPWALDDVTSHESIAIYRIRRIASRSQNLAIGLAAKSWVRDGITPDEAQVIYSLHQIVKIEDDSLQSQNLADRLLAKSWVQDGITPDEMQVIYSLRRIIHVEDDSLQQEVIEKAVEILDMPFLDSVESPDAMAFHEMAWIERAGTAEFLRIMAHPTLSDGITDEEAKIVTLLHSTNKYMPEYVDVLLDGDSVFLEERTIDLPHTGQTLLTIIRLRNVKTQSMDVLEHAVRVNEEYMGHPYYTNWIAELFIADPRERGAEAHHYSHFTFDEDKDDRTWERAFYITHEVAHYYWRDIPPPLGRNNPSWLNEGAANFLGLVGENKLDGTPIHLDSRPRPPCAYATTIAELEALNPKRGTDQFRCNYRLGEALIFELYHTLGEDAFQQGFRTLYRKSLHDDPTDDCEGIGLGICHVEAAFKHGASPGVVATVDRILLRRYGPKPWPR